MIHTAQVEDGGILFTLAGIDGEIFYAIPFEPEPGHEAEIASCIEPEPGQDQIYAGLSKAYLVEKGAKFATL